MKALLIEWDPNTGKRAGNINPKDRYLQCNGWQNMETIPAIELRIIKDDRDISQFKNIKGITVLEGRDAINESIDTNFKIRYCIDDDVIYSEHLKNKLNKKEIDIEILPDEREERLKTLKKMGVKGIREIKPLKV
jgi:hypothetical protein